MNIGFIGLGIMGEAMCANIIKKHDGKVFLYDLNRKMLSEIAISDPAAFTALTEQAKAALK